jgi:hypothetical protein
MFLAICKLLKIIGGQGRNRTAEAAFSGLQGDQRIRVKNPHSG